MILIPFFSRRCFVGILTSLCVKYISRANNHAKYICKIYEKYSLTSREKIRKLTPK
jgi:phosphate uptake regulator